MRSSASAASSQSTAATTRVWSRCRIRRTRPTGGASMSCRRGSGGGRLPYPGGRGVTHRVGDLRVGDVAFVVAVAADHRGQALGCAQNSSTGGRHDCRYGSIRCSPMGPTNGWGRPEQLGRARRRHVPKRSPDPTSLAPASLRPRGSRWWVAIGPERLQDGENLPRTVVDARRLWPEVLLGQLVLVLVEQCDLIEAELKPLFLAAAHILVIWGCTLRDSGPRRSVLHVARVLGEVIGDLLDRLGASGRVTRGPAVRAWRPGGRCAGWVRTGRFRRPATRRGLTCEDTLGDDDLLFTGGHVGLRGELAAAVTRPRARAELQATVVAVTGIDGPVAGGLALSHLIPFGVGGVRRPGAQECCSAAEDGAGEPWRWSCRRCWLSVYDDVRTLFCGFLSPAPRSQLSGSSERLPGGCRASGNPKGIGYRCPVSLMVGPRPRS